MTNNRKPVDEVRLSLSAAREDDGQPLHIATEGSLKRSFGKSATCALFEDITSSRDLPKDTSAYEVELHGPERDAIVAECRRAMGL